MEIQEYLRKNSISKISEFDINTNYSSDNKLIIFNYGIKSSKVNKITREARALVLENNTWNVVSRGFERFFNLGEVKEIENKFNWSSFITEEKIDGSLVLLTKYNNEWLITTRNSFANGTINGYNGTWRDLFLEAGGNRIINYLEKAYWELLYYGTSFVFELCSPYTKVVKYYSKPVLFLLTSFRFGKEWLAETQLDYLARYWKISRPQRHIFHSLNEIYSKLDKLDPTDEGFVIKDSNNLRLKIKNKAYVALHTIKGNNNVFLPKYLVPFLITKEKDADELLTYFPEVKDKFESLKQIWLNLRREIITLWEDTKYISSQKEFALAVKDSKVSKFLFNIRKNPNYTLCSKEVEEWFIKYIKECNFDLD